VFLCYADESGYNGSVLNLVQPVQVMAAIVPNAYNYHRSDAEFREIFNIIKGEIPLNEIKGEQIYRGRGSWQRVPPQSRDRVIGFYLRWVSSRNHKLIVTAIDNAAFFKLLDDDPNSPFVASAPCPYLLAGLHTAMVIQKLNRKKSKNKGKTLLIFDEQEEYSDLLPQLIFDPPAFIDEFVEFDHKKDSSRLSQVIDTAFFVKSHQSSMAQVVDVVAYLFRLNLELQHYGMQEAYPGEAKKISRWVARIQPNFVPFALVYPRPRTPFLQHLQSIKAKGV